MEGRSHKPESLPITYDIDTQMQNDGLGTTLSRSSLRTTGLSLPELSFPNHTSLHIRRRLVTSPTLKHGRQSCQKDHLMNTCIITGSSAQFSSVQLLSQVRLFATPWITILQASLSITNSRSSLKLMSIELVMPSRHLILCHPLLLLPPIPPSIRVFSNESTLCMRWPKYWSFNVSISPSNKHLGLISFRMDWLESIAVLAVSLQFKGLSRVFYNTTGQKHQFFGAQLSL